MDLSDGTEKCRRLVSDFGFDAVINYREEDLPEYFRRLCPQCMDIFFDNVGGQTLNIAMKHLREHARVVLCGAVFTYEAEGGVASPPGPDNLFAMVTKRALLKGFMYTGEVVRYSGAPSALEPGLTSGTLRTRNMCCQASMPHHRLSATCWPDATSAIRCVNSNESRHSAVALHVGERQRVSTTF